MRTSSCAVVAAVLLLAYAGETAAQAVCGNGVREAAEQCDDGNAENLDGCSSSCRFEQVHRLDALKIQRITAQNCPANAFGGAITAIGLSSMQTGIDAGVTSGATSILFVMADLDDLSGSNDGSLSVGVMNAQPVGAVSGYDGTNDPDGWYSPDQQDIDASRNPLRLLPAGISANFLTAGPGRSRIAMVFGAGLISLDMSSLTLRATIGASNPPLMASSPGPPGHLASENLDPALTSFATSGNTITGELCGHIAALSLKAAPIPPGLLSGPGMCLSGSAPKYTAPNSLLDLWVGGCAVSLGVSIVNPTQPDKQDQDAPAAGAGFPYTLIPNATTKIVDTCRDKNNTVVDFELCLADAAYSSFWKFQTERVIATRQCPNAPVASNDGPVCEGADVQLTAKGPSGTYSWTGPNGFVSNLQNPTIETADADAAGLYEVTVTLAGCTSPPASTTVVVKIVPQPQITAPSSAPPGATALVASVIQTDGSTYNWSITNGTITGGQGTSQITFDAGVSGSVELTVVEVKDGCTSAAGSATVLILTPPDSVTATAVASDRILIQWTAGSGASAYEVVRTSAGGVSIFPPTTELTFEDTTVTPNDAYLYAVRSIDSSNNPSTTSAADLATAIVFTDVLIPHMSAVKAFHISQLRTAVAAVRRLASLSPASFGDDVESGDLIQAEHVASLRMALDGARSALMLAPLVYTDSVIESGITPVRAAHMTELRSGTE